MPTFETRSGGHVSIYVPWRPDPIEIHAGGAYETDDKQEMEALRGANEVMERKKGESKAPDAKFVEAEKPAVPVEAPEEQERPPAPTGPAIQRPDKEQQKEQEKIGRAQEREAARVGKDAEKQARKANK